MTFEQRGALPPTLSSERLRAQRPESTLGAGGSLAAGSERKVYGGRESRMDLTVPTEKELATAAKRHTTEAEISVGEDEVNVEEQNLIAKIGELIPVLKDLEALRQRLIDKQAEKRAQELKAQQKMGMFQGGGAGTAAMERGYASEQVTQGPLGASVGRTRMSRTTR